MRRRLAGAVVCGMLALGLGTGCVFDTSGVGSSSAGEVCTNGVDDDGDNLIDCDDPDCNAEQACNSNSNSSNELCANNADDDGDNLIDCNDPDCSQAPNCQVELCANNADDDGDSLIDCDDPDCFQAPNCQPELCANGSDDDSDGLIDCDDPDCLGTPDCGVCNPITSSGCSSGDTCYLVYNLDWFGTCIGGSGSASQGDYCDEYVDCLPGYYCSGSYYVCLRVCHPGSSDCSSISGANCRAFSDWGSDSPWGVCVW